MLRSDWTTGIATAGLALGLSGCFAYNQGVRDIDRHPTVDTGVGASILMPGQAAPTPDSWLKNRLENQWLQVRHMRSLARFHR